MLKHDRSELDYSQLVKKARRILPGTGRKLRIALLADVSTQHLVPLFRALFSSNGVDIQIYEAGFDTIELEAYNTESGLYAFAPQIVIILQTIVKLKAAFYEFPGDRALFSKAQGNKIEAVWQAIQSRIKPCIIQSTFVLPYERPFGNFSHKVIDNLQFAVTELNRELCQRARSFPSVFINDVDHLAAWNGRRYFLDEKIWALAKSLCALQFLPEVAQNIVDIALASIGRSIKCVVIDLDNTLWGGVVGDDGLEGIGLGDLDDGDAFRFFQLYLRELHRRGIILAVCSKNDDAIARRVFREHPGMVLKEEHIAVFVANWEDKAVNIHHIRERLNIGFESMVFLDDNPFERNLVRGLIPEIIVPELPEDPALYVRAISELNLFETASHSGLDDQRNALYQQQNKREVELQKFADIGEYLQSLETTVQFSRFEPQNLPRIAQLIQRSNQFNLTTKRYSESECEAMMVDGQGFFPFSMTVHDRFGDFGLINVVVLHHFEKVLEIDAFLMSCRVLQRGVEQFAMNKIFEYAQDNKFERVVGHYIPTAKNAMVKNFYEQFGFIKIEPHGGEGAKWSLLTKEYIPRRVFIRELSKSETINQGETERDK